MRISGLSFYAKKKTARKGRFLLTKRFRRVLSFAGSRLRNEEFLKCEFRFLALSGLKLAHPSRDVGDHFPRGNALGLVLFEGRLRFFPDLALLNYFYLQLGIHYCIPP